MGKSKIYDAFRPYKACSLLKSHCSFVFASYYKLLNVYCNDRDFNCIKMVEPQVFGVMGPDSDNDSFCFNGFCTNKKSTQAGQVWARIKWKRWAHLRCSRSKPNHWSKLTFNRLQMDCLFVSACIWAQHNNYNILLRYNHWRQHKSR